MKSVSPLILDLPRAEGRQHAADQVHVLGVVEFEAGAEDAGQVADILGDEEIALHEALDAQHADALGITHALGQFGLHVEGQLLFGAAR